MLAVGVALVALLLRVRLTTIGILVSAWQALRGQPHTVAPILAANSVAGLVYMYRTAPQYVGAPLWNAVLQRHDVAFASLFQVHAADLVVHVIVPAALAWVHRRAARPVEGSMLAVPALYLLYRPLRLALYPFATASDIGLYVAVSTLAAAAP